MRPTRWLLILSVVAAVIATFALSDPERLARLTAARREAMLSPEGKDIVTGLIVLAAGAYLAWFTLFRREK